MKCSIAAVFNHTIFGVSQVEKKIGTPTCFLIMHNFIIIKSQNEVEVIELSYLKEYNILQTQC